jgi:hypothetical protein
LNAFQDQISILLAALGENQRLQIQWYCDSDYQRELLRYREETQSATNPWSRRCRNERFVRYWRAMEDRKLRLQRLAIYVSRRIESGPVFDASRADSKGASLKSGCSTLSRTGGRGRSGWGKARTIATAGRRTSRNARRRCFPGWRQTR